jgi:hypothetical protein
VVANGVLGKFDPSGLANDSYVLRLEATDAGGNVSFIDTTVNVAGDLKLGNFTLSFTDLSIPVSSVVYIIARLRTVNQAPALLERYTLPVRRFPGLERQDLQARSVFEVLASEYGVAIERAWQSLEPVLASAYEAEHLQVTVGAPLMLERRISFDAEGRPVEAGRDLYRGDRFRFITETAPREG